MRRYTQLALDCVKLAWTGSIPLANSWGSLLGATAVYGVLWWRGSPMSTPNGWLGIVEVSAMCLGAAWVLIFLCGLLASPFRLAVEARRRQIQPISLGRLNIGLATNYDTKEVRSEDQVRNWIYIILRNIGSTSQVKNIDLHWQKFRHGKPDELDILPIACETFTLKAREQKFIPIAYRDETIRNGVVKDGGLIFLACPESFGEQILYKDGHLRLTASSHSGETCTAGIHLYLDPFGRLAAAPSDQC